MYVNDVDNLLPWMYGYIAIAVLGALLAVGSMAYYWPWRAVPSKHTTRPGAAGPVARSVDDRVHHSHAAEPDRAA